MSEKAPFIVVDSHGIYFIMKYNSNNDTYYEYAKSENLAHARRVAKALSEEGPSV